MKTQVADKVVIDADNMKVLERFKPKEVFKIKAKYEADGRWQDVQMAAGRMFLLIRAGT